LVFYIIFQPSIKEIKHIIFPWKEDRYVWLDSLFATWVIFPQQEGGIPLIQILDHTVSWWTFDEEMDLLPLKDKSMIEERQDIVEFFYLRTL